MFGDGKLDADTLWFDFSSEEFDLLGAGIYNFGEYELDEATGNLVDDSGTIFFSVPLAEAYRVTTTATLTDLTWGYGLLIESTLPTDSQGQPEQNDSGWSIQFDRHGTSSGKYLYIRERTNGHEGGAIRLPIVGEGTAFPDLTESWWEEEHTMEIEVNPSVEGKKGLNISIDGIRLTSLEGGSYTLEITDKVREDQEMYVGLRTWEGDVEFSDLKVDY